MVTRVLIMVLLGVKLFIINFTVDSLFSQAGSCLNRMKQWKILMLLFLKVTSCFSYWFTLSDYMNESASFVSINILLAIWILCYYYFFVIVHRRSESRWITFPRIGRFGSWRGRFRINYHLLNLMMWFESNSTQLENSLRSGFFFRLQRKLDYKDRCTECEAAILKA